MGLDLKDITVIVSVILVIYLIVTLSRVLSKASDLKSAFEYGSFLQKECVDSFMERERGDYQAYVEYKKNVEDSFKTSFWMLAILFIMLCMLGNLFIIIGVITTWENMKSVFKNEWFSIFVTGAVAAGMVAALSILSAMWIMSFKNDNRFGNVYPFALKYRNGNKDFYIYQIVSILSAALVFIGLGFWIQVKSTKDWLKRSIWILLGITLVLSIFVPLVSSYISKINTPMEEYLTRTKSLNNSLGNMDTKVESKLQQNIYTITGKTDRNPKEPTQFKEDGFEDNRFSYITHYPNYSDLQLINIPNELRPYIDYSYLNGEIVLEVKRSLSKFFNDRNMRKYELDSSSQPISNYIHGDSKVPLGYEPFLAKNIIPYLTTEMKDIMYSTGITEEEDLQKKREFLIVINEYVIVNPMFSKANPFSTTIYNTLQEMRQDKSIEKAITGMNRTVKGLVYFIVFLIGYIVYHNAYKNFPEKTLQTSTIIVISLLLLGVAGGYFTKDLWL